MLRIFLITLHVTVSAILISMVLLQKGKGADIGAAFGGASQTVFGPRGAQSFLSKLTTAAAVIFMITSLTLAFTTAKRSSIMEGLKQEKTQTAPAEPLAPPAQVPVAPAPAK
jgi:preprotein translocase subunit SecG